MYNFYWWNWFYRWIKRRRWWSKEIWNY